MTQMYLVSPHQVDEVWGAVAPLAERARERVGHDVETHELWTAARGGTAFLFVSEDLKTVAIGDFQTWRRKPVFKVLCLGSTETREWPEMMEQAKQFAQANGAVTVIYEGRGGWAKKIKDARYVRSFYEVPLDGRQ